MGQWVDHRYVTDSLRQRLSYLQRSRNTRHGAPAKGNVNREKDRSLAEKLVEAVVEGSRLLLSTDTVAQLDQLELGQVAGPHPFTTSADKNDPPSLANLSKGLQCCQDGQLEAARRLCWRDRFLGACVDVLSTRTALRLLLAVKRYSRLCGP